MQRLLTVCVLSAALAAAVFARESLPPVAAAPQPAAESGLPVGTWNVQFANGVHEVCQIGPAGECFVEEPLRRSLGNVSRRQGAFVLRFADDRLERWTPVGGRYVVEHWFPASEVPAAAPVLGIAELGQ